MSRGICRWCKCSHFKPCPDVCGWANREQTLCTSCVNVDREFRRRCGTRDAQMVRPFFRGYMAGTDDERATESKNPYAAPPKGKPSRGRRQYWDIGFAAGQLEAR